MSVISEEINALTNSIKFKAITKAQYILFVELGNHLSLCQKKDHTPIISIEASESVDNIEFDGEYNFSWHL